MPAIPAPSTSTDAPRGAPEIDRVPNGDSAAKPSAVIAWYIAAPPAVTPIMRKRSRRLSADEGIIHRSIIARGRCGQAQEV